MAGMGPLVFKLGKPILVGLDNSLDAVAVESLTNQTWARDMWTKHTRRSGASARFGFNLHITLGNEMKEKALRRAVRRHDGIVGAPMLEVKNMRTKEVVVVE